jgi:hypothetical protein
LGTDEADEGLNNRFCQRIKDEEAIKVLGYLLPQPISFETSLPISSDTYPNIK